MIRLTRLVDAASVGIVLLAIGSVGVRSCVEWRGADHITTSGSIPPERFDELIRGARFLGPRDAPVLILLYSDYACGFCAELHETLRHLRERYPQHLAVGVKHFVHPDAIDRFRVPEAAECAADEDRFREYHDAAFRESQRLHYSLGWLEIGRRAGIRDTEGFASCVRARRHRARVMEHYREARLLGVEATPTMFINGLPVVGAVPLPQLDSIVVRQFERRG